MMYIHLYVFIYVCECACGRVCVCINIKTQPPIVAHRRKSLTKSSRGSKSSEAKTKALQHGASKRPIGLGSRLQGQSEVTGW